MAINKINQVETAGGILKSIDNIWDNEVRVMT